MSQLEMEFSYKAFHEHILNSQGIQQEFANPSLAGDHMEMIKCIISRIPKMTPKEKYLKKEDSQASNFAEDPNPSIDTLTRYLFCADPKGPHFNKILTRRAKLWFDRKEYKRALRDLLNLSTCEVTEDSEKLRTECLKKLKSNSSKFTRSPKIPKIEGEENKKLKSCFNAVSLSWCESKGRHLVANRNIRAGAVLIVDFPFAFSTDENALRRNCLHCHVSFDFEGNVNFPCRNCQTVAYCSKQCEETSWEKYHKYECRIFGLIFEVDGKKQRAHSLLAYRTTLSCFLSSMVSNKHLPNTKETVLKSDDFYDPLDYRTVLSLENHSRDFEKAVNLTSSIQSVFLTKCLTFMLGRINGSSYSDEDFELLAMTMLRNIQAINCNAYEIVENLRDEKSKYWEPRNIGGAVYSTVSLTNHSCYPNIVRHSYPNGIVVARSTRFIRKGEEVLDCYGPHFLSEARSERQNQLAKQYFFTCSCEACANDWPQNLSQENIPFKCKSCTRGHISAKGVCSICNSKHNLKKLQKQLEESVGKFRTSAIQLMFNNNYESALPLLLDHMNFIDKLLVDPNLESIKTQQSIIQCFNSFGCTAST